MATFVVNNQLFALYSVEPDTTEQEPMSFSGVVLLSPTVTQTTLDLLSDQRFGDRKFSPKRIWVDNSQSGISVTINVPGTGQSLVIKASTQGIYPLLAQDSESGALFKLVVSGVPAQLVSIPIQILNTRIEPFVWATV